MLVLKDLTRPEAQEGEWFERILWGCKVRFKVRPRTNEIVKSIGAKFEDYKDGQKKKELVEDAIWDHVFENFEGFGVESPDGTVSTLDVSNENKKKIMSMEVPYRELSNSEWILNKANGMAFKIVEDEVGNL
jgi:hypothetical protein